MIVVRDIFQVKFGRMKEAKEIWGQMRTLFPGENKPRILTDLTGAYYTLVMETTHKDLSDYESSMRQSRPGIDARMGELYQKFVPLVDSGRREIFTIVE